MKLAGCLALGAALCGCTTVRESTPQRTATEQLLLSTAADHALDGQRFPWLAGKKVFVEDKYFESYDKGYAVGLIRERFAADGALLMTTQNQAEVVVEIRSGAFSMDNQQLLVGLPTMTLPVPLTGPMTTPEVAFYKRQKSDSVAKFVLFAYEGASRRYLQSESPMLGRSKLYLYKLVFVPWQKTDVPELIPPKKEK